MKRMIPLLLVLLTLVGCRGLSLYPDEYSYVNEHQAPYAIRETTTEPPVTETEPKPQMKTISNPYQIRDAIVELILAGEESGTFLVREDYGPELEKDAQEMFGRILKDFPKYNYAMDSFDCFVEQSEGNTYVKVNMKLHLSPQELQAIESRSFQSALRRIQQALCNQVSSFTIQISNFPEDTDLNAILDDYILRHPYEVVEPPRISIGVYPDRGDTRVVDLHFVYDKDIETLNNQKQVANEFMRAFSNHFYASQSAEEIVAALYSDLVPPTGYSSSDEATVYTQVAGQKLGSSRTMASVVEYFCKRIGAESDIVVGVRDGESWYWNCIYDGEQWRMFDLHAAALSGKAPVLLQPWEMEGYSWDPERYPELLPEKPQEPEPTAPPTPPEPTEPAEPPESTAPTESTPLTEPPESTAPTEPPPITEPPETEPPIVTTETDAATEPAPTEATEEP